jgi:hypothetical protein
VEGSAQKVGRSHSVGVSPERRYPQGGVPSIALARRLSSCGIRFRATGESPALEEGKDIEWLKPCLLNIEAVKLDHHGGEWM